MKLNDVLNSDEQREMYDGDLDCEVELVESDSGGETYYILGRGSYFFSSNCGSDAHSETGEEGTWSAF